MQLPRLALAALLSLCSLVTASTLSHGQVPFLSPEQLAAASTTAEKHEYQVRLSLIGLPYRVADTREGRPTARRVTLRG